MAQDVNERAKAQRDWMRKDRIANLEKYRERSKQTYLKRKEKALTEMKSYRVKNKDRIRAQQKVWRDNNKDVIRRNNLKRLGITPEEVDAMRTLQGEVCAICSVKFATLPPKHIHVDHCHFTGKHRGILCHGCNTGIGGLKDDPELLRKAIDYLEKGKTRGIIS